MPADAYGDTEKAIPKSKNHYSLQTCLSASCRCSRRGDKRLPDREVHGYSRLAEVDFGTKSRDHVLMGMPLSANYPASGTKMYSEAQALFLSGT
jgi:hypothetical protein